MAEVLNDHLKLPPMIYRRYSSFIGRKKISRGSEREPDGGFENLRNGVEGGTFNLFNLRFSLNCEIILHTIQVSIFPSSV